MPKQWLAIFFWVNSKKIEIKIYKKINTVKDIIGKILARVFILKSLNTHVPR